MTDRWRRHICIFGCSHMVGFNLSKGPIFEPEGLLALQAACSEARDGHRQGKGFPSVDASTT